MMTFNDTGTSRSKAADNQSVNLLTLGYDLTAWHDYGAKIEITTDISPSTNSHMLISGMSGSGKTYAEQQIMARLTKAETHGEMIFADYKGDDTFAYLRESPRYYSFKNSYTALDTAYERLNARLSGEDTTRNPFTLVFDEYMASILALTNEDKKKAAETMNKVSEILLMGRSMSVRFVCSCQRPDAVAFPVGSRLNYGVVIVLGAYLRSIYEMLMPDHMDIVKEYVSIRPFSRGEGVVLLQGTELRFIKIPNIPMEKVQPYCLKALSYESESNTKSNNNTD
jgi:hypothetical protein